MRRKRLILIPFVALAAATALAASAFACTVFRGTFTIKGDASATSVTATGDNASFMTQTVSAGIAKASATGGTVSVSTGADPANAANKLPASTAYRIRFYNSTAGAPGYSDHTTWTTDCMVGSSGSLIGTVTVGSTGAIVNQPQTFSLPSGLTADTAPAESAVCISDDTAANGNEAPLTIL